MYSGKQIYIYKNSASTGACFFGKLRMSQFVQPRPGPSPQDYTKQYP